AVPHEVVDQPAILADPPGAAPVGDARRLHDRAIIAHVVDDPDKAAVEHRQRLVQDLLERRHGDPPGRRARAALGGDLLLLYRSEPFSKGWICGMRPSRRPFRGLLRMRVLFYAIHKPTSC